MKKSKLKMSRQAIAEWLNNEKEEIEKDELSSLSYWFHSGSSNGFGVASTGLEYSGEYNVHEDGKVTMYVDDGPDDIVFESESSATTDRDVKNLFENFKKKVYEKST